MFSLCVPKNENDNIMKVYRDLLAGIKRDADCLNHDITDIASLLIRRISIIDSSKEAYQRASYAGLIRHTSVIDSFDVAYSVRTRTKYL
ncbi:hypothetical protein J6590_031753 [Homalodisca vitripennis]|nr:hypothetical protein J6590_031753 [Homalodisca vitripennis]